MKMSYTLKVCLHTSLCYSVFEIMLLIFLSKREKNKEGEKYILL